MALSFRGKKFAAKTLFGVWLLIQRAGPSLLAAAAAALPVSAQQADLEKQIQNPVASLISLPFQNNIDTGIGDFDRARNTLNFQPVIPASLGRATLIIRTIVPVITLPIGDTDSKTGLGDINMSVFLFPK